MPRALQDPGITSPAGIGGPRLNDQGLQFGETLLAGLAPDGGLCLPEPHPDLTDRLPG